MLHNPTNVILIVGDTKFQWLKLFWEDTRIREVHVDIVLDKNEWSGKLRFRRISCVLFHIADDLDVVVVKLL